MNKVGKFLKSTGICSFAFICSVTIFTLIKLIKLFKKRPKKTDRVEG